MSEMAISEPTPNRLSLALSWVRKHLILSFAVAACLASALYWMVIASDRYVSEAHIIIEKTNLTGTTGMDITSLLGSSTSNRSEQLLMRDYLLSLDLLQELDRNLHLRQHYSSHDIDPLSRMWSDTMPLEDFYQYYRSRVSIELDEYAGVLVISAQGYTPEKAHAITAFLVHKGEDYMNQMAHKLAREQVAFLEKQVNQRYERATETRQALIAYQNRQGLISPQATAETIAAIIGGLQGQLAELETQRQALLAYLVPTHPNITRLDQQISAIKAQIEQEKSKLVSPDARTLNTEVEEYQRLEMEAAFAQDVYKTALQALEQGRVEATRTIKKVSILQAPNRPELALQPRRMYETIVYCLVIIMISAVVQLLLAIIKDHKD